MAQPELPEEPVELTLGAFDNHGTTRASIGRKPIEVEHGIPGELVEAKITPGKRAQGRILRVIEAAPDRIEAPCVYFREWKCGGCQWQHISYEGQLARKREEVDGAMRDAGLDLTVGAVHTDGEWRYRSSAGIALGRAAGFRRRASLAIVPIHDCPISHPLIGGLMATLNDRLEAGALPDFKGRLRLDVRVIDGPDGEGLQVLVRPDPQRWPEREDINALLDVLQTLPDILSLSQVMLNGDIDTLRGAFFGTVEVAGRPVTLASGSFFQTNLTLLPVLIDRLREAVGDLKGKRLADVYGGVGIFALFLGENARDVAVIESDPLATEAGERTATAWGRTNIRFLPHRAEDELEGDGPHDVVIVDPPRTGLSEGVIDVLVRQKPGSILYVSCLADSLARDLALLTANGYTIESLELFDFYPQTYHVELLAVLRLAPDIPEE